MRLVVLGIGTPRRATHITEIESGYRYISATGCAYYLRLHYRILYETLEYSQLRPLAGLMSLFGHINYSTSSEIGNLIR